MMTNSTRRVELTTQGHRHGGIQGLISGMELRSRLKPFVFLDHFDVATHKRWGFPFHPHSGVATFTYPLRAQLHHEDTGGHSGVLEAGAVQWMAAGEGVWHEEYYQPEQGRVVGLQLWVMLPPELESGPVSYQQKPSAELPVVGGTRVLAGSHEGATSPVVTPYPFNYFDVELQPGQVWRLAPPTDHEVAWLYTYNGPVALGEQQVDARTLAVLERSAAPIEVTASQGPSRFVIGTAAPFPHSIVSSRTSIHTNEAALQRGAARIGALGEELRRAGRI